MRFLSLWAGRADDLKRSFHIDSDFQTEVYLKYISVFLFKHIKICFVGYIYFFVTFILNFINMHLIFRL